MNINPTSNDEEEAKESIAVKYGVEPEIGDNGLPILPDKSKYKAVAMEYCQKMGWKKPLETTQSVGAGFMAVVTFGGEGNERTISGNGLRQKNAIYDAYSKLVPIVIPKEAAIELMIKWVPGYKKQKKLSMNKHPKSELVMGTKKLYCSTKNNIFCMD